MQTPRRSGHCCGFVPPYVQLEVERQLVHLGLVRDLDDLTGLADAAREHRSSALNERAERQSAVDAEAEPVTASRRLVYDCERSTVLRKKLVRAEGDPEVDDIDAINAYNHAGSVRSYFAEMLRRDSIDNAGMDLVLNVHYGVRYNNAFWDGDEMTFGDGDGVIFSGFARSLDVVAHELAHGVTQFTSALVYRNEAGALNEHFSDVFGTAITQWAAGERPEHADWLIGDEIMGPDLYGEALRSMAHPGTAYDNALLGKDPQPAHYRDRYTGTSDNGGVHINSGIANRAFYLVASELGDTMAAARIWYHALQALPSTATFAKASEQLATSARVMVKAGAVPKGSTQAVRAAWREVGVVA